MAGRVQWEAQVDSNVAKLLSETKELRNELETINKKDIKLDIDSKSLNSIVDLFGKMETHLKDLKKVFVDVGDGAEFSPLLKTINNIQSSIDKVSASVKNIGFNMNIDFGSDTEMEAKIQSKISNALQAYQRLFDHIKMSSAGGAIINTKFFDFDINQYDTMMGKLQAYKKFIENMRNEAKAYYGGQDVLFQDTEKSYWTSASAAMGQVTKAFNEMNASADTKPLDNLFGKTDLTEVVSQLGLIVNKLEEISSMASKLAKVDVSPTPIKDTFQGGKIEQATTSAKELDKTLEQAVDVSTDDFDEILSKLDLTKSKLGEIIKITKQTHIDADGKPIESYTLKDKYGSTEIYGESSNPQLLRSNIVEYDAKQKAKEETVALKEKAEAWNKNIKAIQEYMDANTKLNNLKAQDAGTGKKASEIAYQTKEVEKLEKVALEARATLSSMINPHEAPIDDWNKWLEAMKQFDQATEGSARSVARLEDALRNMAKSQSDKIRSMIESNQAHFDKLKPTEGNRSVEFEKAVQNYEKAINVLKEFHSTLDATTPLTKKQYEEYEKLTLSLKDARVEMEKFSAAEKGSTESSRWKEIDKISKYLEKNTRISKEAREQLEAYIDTLKHVSGVNVDDIHLQFNKIAEAERRAGREGKSFWDILTDKAIYGYAAQLANYYLSFMDIIRYVKYGITTVRELDTALTEMRKVSDESVASLKRFQDASFDLADGVGTTAKQIQNSTADWMRLGYSISEASALAENSNIYKNVGDMEIDEATEHMVSSVQAWKSEFNDNVIETSEAVINRYNKIGNEFAISSADIGEAMETSAAALKAGGNSLNESLGLLTAGNIIQQDASTTSAALKILSLRIRGKVMPPCMVTYALCY